VHRRKGGGRGRKVEGRTGAEGGGWGRDAGGEGACEEEREVGRREGGVGVRRGGNMCGEEGSGREGVEETSRIVTSSEDARLVVRVLHVLHRAVICRQTRTKRLAAIHCATVVSGLHVSDTSLLFILRNLEKSQVGNPMQSLSPGNQLHRFLRRQRLHNLRAILYRLLRHLHLQGSVKQVYSRRVFLINQK